MLYLLRSAWLVDFICIFSRRRPLSRMKSYGLESPYGFDGQKPSMAALARNSSSTNSPSSLVSGLPDFFPGFFPRFRKWLMREGRWREERVGGFMVFSF